DNEPEHHEVWEVGAFSAGNNLDWRWIHIVNTNNYAEWDMGTTTHELRVYPSQDHDGPFPSEFNEYAVKVSLDGATWTDASSTALYVDDIHNVRAHDGVRDYFLNTPFRYVRINP